MKRFLFLGVVISIVGSAGFYCKDSKNVTGLKGEIRIAGGTAHVHVQKEIAGKLMKDNPGLRISIAGGGSGVGIKQVGEGIIDIGNSGRDLKETEISKYGLVLHAMAIDGIAVIVHPSSGVDNLSTIEVEKIFTGKIKNWKEISSNNSPINIYTRDKESGTRKTFVKLLLDRKTKLAKSAHFVKSNGEMKTVVANDKSGIGFVSVGHIDDSVKAISIDNVSPTLENIKSKKYKVQRSLYMVTKGEAKGNVKHFIDAVLSQYGQVVVAKNYFITVK